MSLMRHAGKARLSSRAERRRGHDVRSVSACIRATVDHEGPEVAPLNTHMPKTRADIPINVIVWHDPQGIMSLKALGGGVSIM